MKNLNWVLVIIGIFGLIGVRVLEEKIFYDPFLNYFHEANANIQFPNFDWAKLIINHLWRFLINLFFSAIVVHFLFLNKTWTLQAVVMMIIVFAITLPIYLLCVENQFRIGYLFSFYIRRFVIQPIILLLIVPMFYYRKFLKENG